MVQFQQQWLKVKVTVEKELVSQAEEEDMEARLGTYVLFSVNSTIWISIFFLNN